MTNDITVINIRDYLSSNEFGEMEIKNILSDFLCQKNPDIDSFLKNNAIDFTKKNQSVTYLVFSQSDAELLGYFTIAIKPICISKDKFSKNTCKKIERISSLDKEKNAYSLSAYLIAQLGKNYSCGLNNRISGEQLLGAAIKTIEEIQHLAGGTIMFLETENNTKLLDFYEKNSFIRFGKRITRGYNKESSTLVQLLKVI